MPKQKSTEQWHQLIEQQAESELSVVEFCQQHGINNKTFYNQRAKVRAEQTPSQFVAAKPSVQSSSAELGVMTLSIAQTKLTLPTTTDPIWLAQLIKALA